MARNEIQFDLIVGKLDDAKKSIENFAKETEKQLSSINLGTSFLALTKVVELAGAAFSSLSGYISEAVSASIEQEDAINNLNVALANSGAYSKEASLDFQAFANSIQATTKYSDDAVLSAAALIENISHLSEGGLKQATQAALDLSAAYNIDLNSASQIIGKAAEGNVTSLNRLGFEIKKGTTDAETFANVISKINLTIGGTAAAQTNTFSGALALVKNQFNELEETFGGLITSSPAIVGLIKGIGVAFNALNESFSKNSSGIKTFINEAIPELVSAISKIVKFFIILGQAIIGVVDAVRFVTSFGSANQSSAGKALSGLSTTLDSFTESILKTIDQTQKAGVEIKYNNKQFNKDIVEEDSKTKEALLKKQQEFGKILTSTVSNILSGISQGAAGVKQVSSAISGTIAEAFKSTPIIGTIVGLVNSIIDFLDQDNISQKIAEFMQGAADRAIRALGNIQPAIETFRNNIADNLRSVFAQLIPIIINALADEFINFASDPGQFGFTIEVVSAIIEGIIKGLASAFSNLSRNWDDKIRAGIQKGFIPELKLAALIFGQGIEDSAKNFAAKIGEGAADFVKQLFSKISGIGGGGGILGGGGGFSLPGPLSSFKFAEGGIVPGSSFQGDKVTANVNSGELIVDRSTTEQLKQFLSGASNMTINLVVGEEQLSSVLVNLNRKGFRTA